MELFNKVTGRIMIIVLSVSVLSLLFSSLPFLLQSVKQSSINKTYVFFFCNGLMVFIAKNSSLPSDSSSSFHDLDAVAESVINSQEHHDTAAADSAEQQEPKEEVKRMIVAESQVEDEVADTEKEEEEEKTVIIAESEEEEEVAADTEREEENGFWITEGEEEEEVEELNKKCEDFIREMKAAFRSEPRFSYGCSDVDHHQTAMVI